MKKAILINTQILPAPGTAYLFATKFLKCFEWFDYEFMEINNMNEIRKLEDVSGTIVFMFDHGYKNVNYKQEIDILSELKNVTFICWGCEEKYVKNKLNNVILTGAKLYKKPPINGAIKAWDLQLNCDNFVALAHGANVHPEHLEIKTDFSKYIYDCNFVGYTYNTDWLQYIQQHLNTFIRSTGGSNYCIGEERINSYKNSLCSLGWQADLNKQNFVISERIFEAMAYGCLVITDAKHIEEELRGGGYLLSQNKIA